MFCTYETDKRAFVVMVTEEEEEGGLSVTHNPKLEDHLWTMFGEVTATLGGSAKGSAAGILAFPDENLPPGVNTA